MKTVLILAGIGLSLAIFVIPLFVLALLLLEYLHHSEKN